jgi:acid phosphatase type 7
MRISWPLGALLAAVVCGRASLAATFTVPDSTLPVPLVFVAYGDIRFTNPSETAASSACFESSCLARWWKTFPELRGRRWYSVALGTKVMGLALDSDTSLLPGSEQRMWFEGEIATLDPAVRVVLIVMHHPPAADVQTVKLVDHNPRPNEMSLAEYLRDAAAHSTARFVVSAGHIHNYERVAQDGVMYLVSGGGGATPHQIDRTTADLYQAGDFPNYHYVRFELRQGALLGEMIRLEDFGSPNPRQWKIGDRFEISLRP